ncbi:hypothetical protein BCR34DRAFT_154124 [Clohesyomyces aquaticus]|uniref:Uncharacterized protein n=1 Tax=Clohesyomyces aquaticus TaxID=1231657 RepID=A0A1Y2A078_9PLEO|nr:hypothetical protein BCR34DRAFT_154124 [Clohesyomyces aquaticus]
MTVHASPLPAKTKKSVRIESPTSSTLYPAFHDAGVAFARSVDQATPTSSPLPVSPAGFSDNFEDQQVAQAQFDKHRASGEDGHGERGLIGNTASSAGTGPPAPSHSSPGVPANPFSRTLATIEPQEQGPTVRHEQLSDRPAAGKAGPGTTKASLDVEGFKRLLMTGISNPLASGTSQPHPTATAPNPISASVFESSSSTDTSSVSRQSIFEPVPEPHLETPRTSYEMAGSDDEERAGLIGNSKRPPKKKPPPPKHRHGKLVTARTPQVVPFSDFSSSFMAEAAEPTSSSVSGQRTDSDLNKPLPPPPLLSPLPHIVSQDMSQYERPSIETSTSTSSGQSDTPQPQKKIPPPVPLARRQSQLRSSTGGSRSRSNSSLTISSQHSTDFPLLSPSHSHLSHEVTSHPQSSKAPPPPPPARRHGTPAASITTSSANSSTTELPSSTTPAAPL